MFSYTPSDNITYYYLSKTEKKYKGHCSKSFLELPPLTKKSTKSQILSLSGPIAFMYHLFFIQLKLVLDNQKN